MLHLKDEIDGQSVLLESEVVHDVLVFGDLGIDRNEERLAFERLGNAGQGCQILLGCLRTKILLRLLCLWHFDLSQ